jgi:formylglycine-generating enzyme required for sulfatase activity
VIRGGGWYDLGWYCRSAYRGIVYYIRYIPAYRCRDLGFRVVLAPGQP